MIPRSWRIALLAATCALQLAVPASWVWRYERALDRGQEFRFRCAPVDPVDLLRGRYVALAFEDATVDLEDGVSVERDQRLFARIDAGGDGFARLTAASLRPPAEGPYLEVRARRRGSGQVDVRLPFDRYYMDESLAPEAERLYRERAGAAAHVTVRVQEGTAVLVDLYLDGLPVRDRLSGAAPAP